MNNKKVILMLFGAVIGLLLIGRVVNQYRISKLPIVELKDEDIDPEKATNMANTSPSDSFLATDKELKSRDTPISHLVKAPLKVFSYGEVSRFTIAAIMGQDPKIIRSKKEGDYNRVSYWRPSDNKLFEYKIRFEGKKIIWANIDGRWRTHPEDERITFDEKDREVTITQTFSDGSADRQTFQKK